MNYDPAKIYLIINLIAVIIAMPFLSVASSFIVKSHRNNFLEIFLEQKENNICKKLSNYKSTSSFSQWKKNEIFKHETVFLEYYNIANKAKLQIDRQSNITTYLNRNDSNTNIKGSYKSVS